MHRSRLGNLVIDCQTDDLPAQARFWSAALGCPLPEAPPEDDRFIQLRTSPGEVQVILQRVGHAPRVHLDLETDAIPEEVVRLERLGAVLVARHEEGWVVMQAPSGHRFCVGRPYRSGFRQKANTWE
ncbi:VOC family protein [Pseudoxanthomonas sp.]|uniref:VOC family protein n=1 Tax=Pseudoxanthomonas sp. TaxID=1871049 RepID=UPI003F7E8D3B